MFRILRRFNKMKCTLTSIIIVVILKVEITGCHSLSYFQKTSIIFSIASQETPLETTCQLHLKEIKDAVIRKDVWAMKGELSYF